MIRLKSLYNREVVEMDPTAKVWLIDGLHYTDTKRVRRIGPLTTLQELQPFEIVELAMGLEDNQQPRVMAIMANRVAT